MTPPMDGTPFFSTPKGSMLASRCVSVICFRFNSFMKYSPKMADINNAKITAISDFDASKKFYIYGFDWYPDKIIWWIRKDINTDKVILWEYKGTDLFTETYAPYGIPVLPAHYTASFWHSTTRLAEGLKAAKEAPKYPFEMEIDWMAYEPFNDHIDVWKENGSK